MKELNIELKAHPYKIIIENGALKKTAEFIKDIYPKGKVFIVTDDVVEKLYLKTVMDSLNNGGYDTDYVVIPHGEESKTLKYYAYVCEELLKKDIRRSQLIIALGGGVIGDLTGFVASSLYRGIPYVGIPTSLLAQMDSSIGGKTAIDFYNRKNILGAFKQPARVIIDPETHKTLDDREFNNGMGELIKHGAIGNKGLLDSLLNKPEIDEDVIKESLSVKKRVVELDEFDTGERMSLNFGHTFGHIIELKYGYKHGEAVAIGMLMALKMGEDLGVTPKDCYPVIYKILKLYNLPTTEYDYKEYLKETMYDKKNIAGTINFILLDKLGHYVIYKLTEKEIKEKLV